VFIAGWRAAALFAFLATSLLLVARDILGSIACMVYGLVYNVFLK
jgi:hypothetical protein